jgi:preprotein translocase subunit SecG
MTDPHTPGDQTPTSNVPPAPPAYGAAQPSHAPAPPAPYGPPAGDVVPGKTLGIVALVVVFFFSLVGLILGYVARSQSKKAGVPNTPAKIAIILGWIFLVLSIIIAVVTIVVLVNAGAGALAELCEDMPPGTYDLTTGGTVTCE